jgi:hypothetical protein
MNADEMKVLLMCYWRFSRQCPLVAQEFDYKYADVIALSKKGRVIHETEVKTSIADMKADRRKPKHHHKDLFGKDKKQIWANYFYFAVPEDIKEQALQVCQEIYPYAGLLVISNDCETFLEKWKTPYFNPWIEEVRKPQYLRAEQMTEERLFKLIKGLSNNLCSKSYELMLLKRGEK